MNMLDLKLVNSQHIVKCTENLKVGQEGNLLNQCDLALQAQGLVQDNKARI